MIEVQCIVTESQTHGFDDDDLICITSAGMVHLELTKNTDYLSAVAEDFWFRELGDALTVRDNIAGRDTSVQFTYQSAVENGLTLIRALQKYHAHFPLHQPHYVKQDIAFAPFDLVAIEQHLQDHLNRNAALSSQLRLKEAFPVGTTIEAQVTNVQQYGVFFEFGLEGKGFAHVSKFTSKHDPTYLEEYFEVGEVVEVTVEDYQAEHGRFRVHVKGHGGY
ncbi:MAG: S1 RNA-binding domain-containing protein [Flavobacteriales bacterium]|nr:S1 RNA-binding domain-containing protein [Flavobacteriales bacterium]